jgi:SAM-dependent methyltransferase
MEADSYRLLASRQDTYWWHRARRGLSRTLLRRYGVKTGTRWLDLGCGPGANLAMLDDRAPERVVGFDLSPLALELARQARPQAQLVRGDLNQPLPFRDRTFDLVTIYNVLYHQWISSELAVMREACRVLAPGGLLLLTEPAFPSITRGNDIRVMTRRRYVERDIDDLFGQAGLQPLFGSYFTSFGYVILRVTECFGGRTERSGIDVRPIPDLVNSTLYLVQALENLAIGRGLRLPFGTTVLKLGRRPRE